LVAVVGGGISGLSAAYALHKAGTPFVLYEASSSFGGVIRSEHVEGFLLEAGPDAILAHKAEGIELCRELGLGDRLVPINTEKRRVYVLCEGRLRPLPEGMSLAVPTRLAPFLASGLFSWWGKLRMGLDLVLPPRRRQGDESIGAFLRRHFGSEAVRWLGEPLLAGIHAGDPDSLSIQATFPRLVELERRYGSLIRGLWAAPPPTGPAFYSLAGGLGELVGALVSRLPPATLRTLSPVRSLSREEGGFLLVLEDGALQRARAVVLAGPPHRMAPLLEPLDAEAAGLLHRIRFASSATVLLGYRRQDVAHPLDGYGLVVPRAEGIHTTACGFSSTKFPGRAPEGHVLLRGFLGGTRDPGVLARDDLDLARLAQEELGPILGLGAPCLVRVYRWLEATPQMEVGHLERIAEVERRLGSVPGLFLTGAGLRVTGIPDCIADATRVAVAASSMSLL
jgi:oxygen-dependent protoporphyrinogen oxidase